MKALFWFYPLAFLVFLMPSCVQNHGQQAGGGGTGPFDSRGNYREDWVDDPSKWRRSSPQSSSDEAPQGLAEVSHTDAPPMHANPLPQEEEQVAPVKKKEVASLTVTSQKAKAKALPKSPNVVKSKIKEPTVKSKAVVAKPKTSSVKSKVCRHLVKKGESLSSIAGRYGVSSTALKKANGILGSVVRSGQTLVIPK